MFEYETNAVGAVGAVARIGIVVADAMPATPSIEARSIAAPATTVAVLRTSWLTSVEPDMYFSSFVVDHSTKLCTYVNAQKSESPRPVLLR